MRILRLIGVVICALAVSAIAVTTASASILPGKKTTIEGGSEKATLQVKGGAAITCPKSTVTSGEVLSTSEALAIIDFGGSCTTAGLPVNSLGDAAGFILVHVEIKECPTDASLLELRILPLHLEVPATGLLLLIEGGAIGSVQNGVKKTTFPVTLTQKEGKNTVEVCGKDPLILLTSTDGGSFVQSGEEAKNAGFTFGEEEEFM